jgi:GNAT superfamily N-acetyltransferase
MVDGLKIRAASGHELSALIELERRAGMRFAAIPGLEHFAYSDLTPLAELEDAHARGLVWVAELDGPELVGWCYAARVDDTLFVEEVDVVPEHGGRGIGRALLASVADRARADGLAALTLTTERDVPWNRPWYERIGFAVVPPAEQSPGLAAKIAHEAARGFDITRRVAMRFDVAASAGSISRR